MSFIMYCYCGLVLSSFIMYIQCCYINQSSVLHPKLVGCSYINLSIFLYSHVLFPTKRVFNIVRLFSWWQLTYRNQHQELGLAIVNVVMLEKVVVSYITGLHIVVSSNVTHSNLRPQKDWHF